MDRLSYGGIDAARILIAVVFVLNGFGIVGETGNRQIVWIRK